VSQAHQLVQDTIDDEGPFDGIIAFSQGASAIISFLLHHKIHQPRQPLPFKLALFLIPSP